MPGPDWSDANSSDAGMTLVELLGFLALALLLGFALRRRRRSRTRT